MNATLFSSRPLLSLACAMGLLLGIGGCGSDNPVGPVSPPEGTGSRTMLVTAEVKADDVEPGVLATEFAVSLRDTLDAPVSGASVQVGTPSGTVTLIEEGITGTYRASRSGYVPGTYTLAVSRGITDWVSGARVTAPDVHTITFPSAGDTVAADQNLAVRWARVRETLEAMVESRDYESPAPEFDDGSSMVPASGNPVRDDQRIRVFRLNRTALAGGLPGSQFEARLRSSVEPVVAR